MSKKSLERLRCGLTDVGYLQHRKGWYIRITKTKKKFLNHADNPKEDYNIICTPKVYVKALRTLVKAKPNDFIEVIVCIKNDSLEGGVAYNLQIVGEDVL